MSDDATVTLYGWVAPREVELIRAGGHRVFPPRLPYQVVFQPALDLDHAEQTAREWCAIDPAWHAEGYVMRFRVRATYARRYPLRPVRGAASQELWIPAEDIEALNRNLVGPIQVIARVQPDA